MATGYNYWWCNSTVGERNSKAMDRTAQLQIKCLDVHLVLRAVLCGFCKCNDVGCLKKLCLCGGEITRQKEIEETYFNWLHPDTKVMYQSFTQNVMRNYVVIRLVRVIPMISVLILGVESIHTSSNACSTTQTRTKYLHSFWMSGSIIRK